VTTSKHTFRWNLPERYDKDELEVEVSYSYYRGRKPVRSPRGWLDADPDLVEEVEIRHAIGPFKGSLVLMLPDWVYNEAESACWDHAAKQEPEE